MRASVVRPPRPPPIPRKRKDGKGSTVFSEHPVPTKRPNLRSGSGNHLDKALRTIPNQPTSGARKDWLFLKLQILSLPSSKPSSPCHLAPEPSKPLKSNLFSIASSAQRTLSGPGVREIGLGRGREPVGRERTAGVARIQQKLKKTVRLFRWLVNGPSTGSRACPKHTADQSAAAT